MVYLTRNVDTHSILDYDSDSDEACREHYYRLMISNDVFNNDSSIVRAVYVICRMYESMMPEPSESMTELWVID